MLFDGFPAAAADFKDPTLRLAANELNALCLKRFGKAGKWDFKFEIDDSLPSFEVKIINDQLMICGPDAVEIL